MKTITLSLLTIVAALPAFASSAPTEGPAEDLTAKRARCQLTIDGASFMDGACNFSFLPRLSYEPGGSFEIRRGGYVVHVITNGDGTSEGYWNGMRGGRSVSVPLGTLLRNGACWVNNRAFVCAR